MKKTTIGGQALIEGVMMKGPEGIAIAVRKPDGEIIIDKKQLRLRKSKLAKLPVIRGIVEFFRIMVIGVKALMYSAEFVDLEEGENAEPSKFDAYLEKMFGDKLKDVIVYFSVIVSIAFTVGLFILLPNLLASILPFDKKTTSGVIYYNLFEGVLRVGIFLGYLSLTSKMKDIQRVWQYHGAEHKTIHCYENEEELTIENVRKYTTKHPRCGTSFIFIVMIVSIIVFAFTGWNSIWVNILLRVALIPFVAGVSYEVLKFMGRRTEWRIVRILSAPGLAFQSFTTREPDDSQIEVAIAAFTNVMVEDKNADIW